MAHMVNTKIKEDSAMSEAENEQYPYGLQIDLDKDSLDKIGMKDLPEVQAIFRMDAKVKVTKVSMTGEGEHAYKNVTFQIIDMELESVTKDFAKAIYGEEKSS